jgi:predicted lipid-binding transport protein (Tim44 family)
MRDFGWGNRIAHVLGGIVEAFIILVAVAVIAAVIVLLVRYLLVATRAAQLYVDQHEPRRDAPATGQPPVDPLSPTDAAKSPTSTTNPATTMGTEPTVAAPAPTTTDTTLTLGEEPTKPLTKPVTKPVTKRTPKAPPAG